MAQRSPITLSVERPDSGDHIYRVIVVLWQHMGLMIGAACRYTSPRFVGPTPMRSQIKANILLLVSDQLIRAVMREVLEDDGYFVDATGDLGSAVDQLKIGTPDLLITRVFVSTMSGHNAAKYLRTKCPQMRVLIVGGILDDDRLRNREELENFHVFPKPYLASEFLEKVRDVLSSPR
jgi:DNA-binding NtrC family response regulator